MTGKTSKKKIALAGWIRAFSLLTSALVLSSCASYTDFGDCSDLFYYKHDYKNAKLCYLQSLERHEKQLGELAPEPMKHWHRYIAKDLFMLGNVYNSLGQYADAVPRLMRSINIIENNPCPEGWQSSCDFDYTHALLSLATSHLNLTQYEKAEEVLDHAFAFSVKKYGSDHNFTAMVLRYRSDLYNRQGRYVDSESLTKQALEIEEKAWGFMGENNMFIQGSLHSRARQCLILGQYDEAEELAKRALESAKHLGGSESLRVSNALRLLADVYSHRYKLTQAEELLQQALKIQRKIKEGEDTDAAGILGSLGTVNFLMGEMFAELGRDGAQEKYSKAQSFMQQSLAIYEKTLMPNDPVLADALSSMAWVYQALDQNKKAESLLKRALSIAARSRQPALLQIVQGGLREIYTQSSPKLAAFYGKQAVDTLQSVRATNIQMDATLQRSFLKRKEGNYTKLADILFAQNRLKEGQLVLAMLKEAEYYEFTGKSADDDPRRSRVAYSPREAKWEQRFQDIAAKLAKADPKDEQFAALTKEMDAFFEDVKRAFAEGAPGEANRLDNTSPMQKPLAQLGEGTVLVQYLMPQERLWLLITTKEGMKARQVNIKADALRQKIEAFKQAIVARSTEVDTLGKELHGLLIAPAAEELKGAKTLMLAPDGELRYLPFAALHDGEQYLAQRYVLSNYTSMTDEESITTRPQAQWHFAGFGASKQVKVSGLELEALPTVEKELQGIQGNAMQGTIWLNEAFTRDALQEALRQPPPVVHVASHFVFEKRGNEQASWLLLGDGGKLTLADIRKNYRFNGVDLVALSACNTGMGGKDKDGREVEGLGVLVQRQGAKGVLASLWEVADESTADFMQRFYRYRQQHGMSKAEALRQAQLDFIGGKAVAAVLGATRGYDCDATGCVQSAPPPKEGVWTHPYHWAPFILMGNWL